jgi:hypothetical protein
MGTFRQKLLHAKEQFGVCDDQKLQMTLVGLADKYSYGIRETIRRAYSDNELASIYRGWKTARAFDKGGKHHKEIIRFPNGHVYDFVDTVLTALYGPKWLQNKKALKHDLVRPWHINKI